MNAQPKDQRITPLRDAALASLPSEIARPLYDRSRLTPGIVHIGVGNFHRAHQSWYLHRLMQMGEALDWAIIGAGVRPYDAAMRDRLLEQDCLTTLIELDPAGASVEVVGSMIDYLPIEPDNAGLIKAMADPEIRIVSLTVTEGGYYLDPVTKAFDAAHPDIIHDAASPERPRTAFGAMVAALRMRRDAGHGPFTALSCDNLLGNGVVLRQTVVSLAQLSDPELAEWIAANGAFPNSMVDCIVPATGEAEIALARSRGIDDKAPVTHENFRQWVIEDAFCAGRPAWEKAGATFTGDVHAYELMKIRVLNAGHQVLANAGELLSMETIADCMANSLLSRFLEKVERSQILPTVKQAGAATPDEYLELIMRRFSNPMIRDTTRRVAFDGSSRHTGFLLPVLRELLARDAAVGGLALVEALWARMCAGTRSDGSVIEPNDPQWDDLSKASIAAKDRPAAWLEQQHIYGSLAEDNRFADPFAEWLQLIWSGGVEAALSSYLGGTRTKAAEQQP